MSERQLLLLEQIATSAILVSLGEGMPVNAARLEAYETLFVNSHSDLLHGRAAGAIGGAQGMGHRRLAGGSTSSGLADIPRPIPSQLFMGQAVERTLDACTLTVMEHVKKTFMEFKTVVDLVISHAGNTSYVAPDIPVEIVDEHMKTAIAYYRAGSGQCQTTLTKTKWEICLEHISHAPYLFQKAQTDFYLLSSGFSQQWVKKCRRHVD